MKLNYKSTKRQVFMERITLIFMHTPKMGVKVIRDHVKTPVFLNSNNGIIDLIKDHQHCLFNEDIGSILGHE